MNHNVRLIEANVFDLADELPPAFNLCTLTQARGNDDAFVAEQLEDQLR